MNCRRSAFYKTRTAKKLRPRKPQVNRYETQYFHAKERVDVRDSKIRPSWLEKEYWYSRNTHRQTDRHRETKGNIIRQISCQETKLYRLSVFYIVKSSSQGCAHTCVLKTVNISTGVRKRTSDTKRNNHVKMSHSHRLRDPAFLYRRLSRHHFMLY